MWNKTICLCRLFAIFITFQGDHARSTVVNAFPLPSSTITSNIPAFAFKKQSSSPFFSKETTFPPSIRSTSLPSQFPLFAKKQKKMSFAEKKKKRRQKQGSKIPVERSAVADALKADTWEKTTTSPIGEGDKPPSPPGDGDETKQKAETLIERQRKSVNMLTHVRECTEELSSDTIRDSLYLGEDADFYVQDGFLNNDEYVSEMFSESVSMLQSDKLELLEVGSGEYGSLIQGGDAYINCPRCTEFVVSFTKHLAPMINDALSQLDQQEDGISLLDTTACIGNILTFDRKKRLSSLELLMKGEPVDLNDIPPRSFQCVNEGKDDDTRLISIVYFMNPIGWDEAKNTGGGITFCSSNQDQEQLIEAKRDRLVIFRSDKSFHRNEFWIGNDDMNYASCIVLHLVKK